jgi:hypothetical protein
MRNNIWRMLVCLLVIIPMINTIYSPMKDFSPDESVGDCTTYANNPYKSGSTVLGSGGVSCLYSHPVIQVVVTVYDVTAGVRSSQGTKSCPGGTSCSVNSGTVPYISGHYYRTEVSVYFSSSNQYAQSSDIRIW